MENIQWTDPWIWIAVSGLGWMLVFVLINRKTVDKDEGPKLDPAKELSQLSEILFQQQAKGKARLLTDGKFQWSVKGHTIEYNTQFPTNSLKVDNQPATFGDVYEIIYS